MLKTAYMAENGMSIRGKKTLIKNGMKAVGKNRSGTAAMAKDRRKELLELITVTSVTCSVS